MSPELDSLASALGVPPARLAPFAAYDARQLATLDALVRRAVAAREAAFREALESALTHVPRVLRPTARKLLSGGWHE